MENSSLLTRWTDLNQRYNYVWSIFILSLMSVSFVVTDWMIGIFTLSDYIFAIVGASLLISGNYRVKRNQVLWILLLLGVIVANIVMNVNLNENFILKTGVAALIRITYYAAIVTGVYNYVKHHQLEVQFLKILNIVAVIVGVLGIYITLALYSEGQLPYEFFWTFTRTDLLSYAFNENTEFIRTRSIFSEPAYLGYFLNIILAMNYFNKVNVRVHKGFSLFITLILLLTFSYSAIGIMIMIQVLHFLTKENIQNFKWSRTTTVYFFLFLIILFFSWDLINETIINRTADILSGEDGSAYFRIIRSWDFVNTEHIFLGNGIGHTPNVWNVYAYILSDLGLIAFLLSGVFSGYLMIINFRLGLVFVALNFQKGGYLNPAFSIFLLLIFIYIGSKKKMENINNNDKTFLL